MTKFRNLSESHCENALKILQEIIDADTQWAVLELMLGTSPSVVALAKKMAKLETKTVTRIVAVPKTQIVKKRTTPKDKERTKFTPIRLQPSLPNQQDNRLKR
ncbi:hypothetical protein N9Q79_01545 [Alphaproteobacteria bacterium]|nr:hypothetical protein [Alphaproteobacteria bacterium]